jgi:small ligand-binding sensory domain FIST
MLNSAASRLVLGAFSEEEVIRTAREALHEIGGRASCAVVFATTDYQEHLPDFLELIQLHGHAPLVVGCSGTGLIGTNMEAERASGFSLLLLHLPNTTLTPFTFSERDVEESSGPGFWQMESGADADAVDAWIVLGDPMRLDLDRWLHDWNIAYPGVPSLGGLASGGARGNETFVFRNREILEGGGVALGLRGGVRLHPLVSQGCTPVGEPHPVTGAEGNVITTLGMRPAYEVLQETFAALPDTVRARAQGNLFAGLATSEYIDEFKRGDFLIRNILGADPTSGAVAIGAVPRVGQTLQFQLRDGETADDDLRELTEDAHAKGIRPFASLLFSCTGRGRGLFGVENHDAKSLGKTFGSLPGAGFFCNGEIGPVGATNFVHGYTASAALLCDEESTGEPAAGSAQ